MKACNGPRDISIGKSISRTCTMQTRGSGVISGRGTLTMHLSKQALQRRNAGKDQEGSGPGKNLGTRRSVKKPASLGGSRPPVIESQQKRFRARNPSYHSTSSSTDDHRGAGRFAPGPAGCQAADTVEESCVALPTSCTTNTNTTTSTTGRTPPACPSRGAGADFCAVSRSNSLPSLAPPASLSPKIARNKTFVFMYDETEKRSKPVKPPDELNISLPVLVQYELTAEENRPDSFADWESTSSQPGATNVNPSATGSALYRSPTVELLQKWDKKEKRNKGMHVMRWLVQVQN